MTLRAEESETTLTARVGNNADLLVDCVKMYANFGDVIVDVTYGKGVFWQKIDLSLYDFKGTDLEGGVDFKNLPYGDASVDLLVLDPPYMHGGATIKASINDCYRNQNTSHASVIRLYAGGILEAARVLKKKGRIFVKCQDEIESGKQRWSHLELMSILESFGFCALDLFVLQQSAECSYRIVGRGGLGRFFLRTNLLLMQAI